MEITPKLINTRPPQADPGDLFIVRDDTGSYVALAVKDPHDGDRFVLVLGPASPHVAKTSVLTGFPPSTIITSFGKEYSVRLPVEASAWLNLEPQAGHCLVLSADKLFIRALYQHFGQAINVYISLADGLLAVDASGHFTRPRDHCTYAVKWDILTIEREPRFILSVGGGTSSP